MISWTVVLPLKGGPGAKSRLGAPAGLARAIALDTLDAALAATAVRLVVVVTPDASLAAAAAGSGAGVVAEPDGSQGLLDAVHAGLAAAERGGPVGVLLGDLPALRGEDLDAALAACTGHPVAFVPDQDGSGTVLLAGRRPSLVKPRFGTGSAKLHADDGAVRLELDLPRLRRDVDTPADLAAAAVLGLGPRTRQVLGGG